MHKHRLESLAALAVDSCHRLSYNETQGHPKRYTLSDAGILRGMTPNLYRKRSNCRFSDIRLSARPFEIVDMLWRG